MRRRRQEQALSLFAFQDIITGVAGIMLFILMLLVVQLALHTAKATDSKNALPPSENMNTIVIPVDRSLELAQLQSALSAIQTQTSKLLDLNFSQYESLSNRVLDDLKSLQLRSAAARERLSALDRQSNEADNKKATAASGRTAADLEAIKQDLDAQLDEWKSKSRVSFTTDDSKETDVWLADVNRFAVDVVRFSSPENQEVIAIRKGTQPGEIASKISSAISKLLGSEVNKFKSIRLVVLIRPSAAGFASELLGELRNLDLEIALELLDAETQIYFPGTQK
jgi:hypothetical protein